MGRKTGSGVFETTGPRGDNTEGVWSIPQENIAAPGHTPEKVYKSEHLETLFKRYFVVFETLLNSGFLVVQCKFFGKLQIK